MSERLTMRKVREILRLRHDCGRPLREIAVSCAVGPATVSDYLARAQAAGLTWAQAATLSDAEVEARLFRQVGRNEPAARMPIDFEWVHGELRRTGVTLQLLWAEYQESAAARGTRGRAYQYSQFCDLYASWRQKLAVSMRQVHRAGEKGFVDYSGKKPVLIDSQSGEVIEVELYVLVLGASNYTYAEATRTQKLGDFVGSTVRAFDYFGAAPHVLVPDQLRSAVSGPDHYEPDINTTFLEMASHYGVAIIPARPRRPRDKAKVEAGVLLAQRWILARLRNRVFSDLRTLNGAIAELLDELNERPFKKLEGCRRSAFESIDRPAMKPLPARRYELGEWSKARVNVDYHLVFDERLYSVPVALVGERVEIRATVTTVEILHGGERVASHARSYGRKGTATTCDEHRPRTHREYGQWPPERMVGWAASFGPNVRQVVECILARYPRPELGYRAALGMMRLAQKHGAVRTDAACARALSVSGPGGPTRKYVEAILKLRLEQLPLQTQETTSTAALHENVRGGDYYAKEETGAERRNDSEDDRNEAHDDGHDDARAARVAAGARAVMGRKDRNARRS
jgi:transposase